nr:hypothetical protein [Tanacetum cinerariifolium]
MNFTGLVLMYPLCYALGSGWRKKEKGEVLRPRLRNVEEEKSDQDVNDALSKLLQMGMMAEYQNEFEILKNRVTRIFKSLLKSFYTFRHKLPLQLELLRLKPTTLGEAFSLARIAEARFEDERPTIAIAKPNDLTARESCFSTLKVDKADNTEPPLSADSFGNNGGDDSESDLMTPAEEVVGIRHISTLFFLFEHESLRSLQLWERIGISDVHGLMDNEGNHNFVQPNAGEQMRLHAMVTVTPWASDNRRRKRVKCYVQGGGRGKKVIGHGNGSPDSARISC